MNASCLDKIMLDNVLMLFIWFLFFSYTTRTSTSLNTLEVSESIRDGETLVSAGGVIEVGFFSPGNSTRRYLGSWYRNVSPLTVLWVANREKPLENNSGVLKLNKKGILLLLSGTNNTIWSSNTSSKAGNNPVAQLFDSGNFVVKNGQASDKDSFVWQSFDYPCDTFAPGMKLGWNLETGLESFVSSWKSADDLAMGGFSSRLDIRGYPQVITFKGSNKKIRTGPWNGQSLVGYPVSTPKISQKFVLNDKEVYYEYKILDSSIFIVYTLTPSGIAESLFWTSQSSNREVFSTGEEDQCEHYAFCGANSVCSVDGYHATCECLKGYVPKFPEIWNISFSSGCVPRNKSNCSKNSYTDGFLKYTHIKLPDTSSSWFNETMNLEECHKSCLKNCSCVAYANLDISNGGSGCLLWFNNLVDLRKFSRWGQDLYVRVPASELDHVAANGLGNKMKKLMGITVGVITFGFITCVSIIIYRKRVAARVYHLAPFQWRHEYFRLRKEDMDLPIFDLSIIVKATDNFSSRNKLGEGGFGPVYKGTLVDGQEVAIKRHSKMSDQGVEEFKNEVLLIAKLQHRNLVKLLGCCIQGEEKMLIYEYMPNKSLDHFIFDEPRSKLLDWPQCFRIIGGVARGLLYLHQDSRLRIVHRDLKTSNILLDAFMNPKISDFGLARTFWGDQIEGNTRRVVGTYGYMPPEYAVKGHYSVKSDIFSFGVIVLEIVSGKKNRGFSDQERCLNLLGHAWRLWTEDRPMELIDKHLCKSFNSSEVIRCINVGLLCVQQKPEDRPDISSVVLMLNGEKLLPRPKTPGFYTGNGLPEAESSSRTDKLFTRNEISLTIFEAR